MNGRDVLVIMVAGGGKSLCYQLPAILRDGVALVISHLLSLIQDQVMGLAALGIPAFMLTSTTTKENEKFIYKALDMRSSYCMLHLKRYQKARDLCQNLKSVTMLVVFL
ncbi:hypothetical protein MTR67_036427 [Solanum verrucosum]|uniref:DNA 3'-5' helicase n=1 Tax=Solanum verrucosum TaxID=315347 RepID=A0AAF0UBR4_SOLVR|nr:hypothetical protein MTR67_036427 [Solanum verrucosum]